MSQVTLIIGLSIFENNVHIHFLKSWKAVEEQFLDEITLLPLTQKCTVQMN